MTTATGIVAGTAAVPTHVVSITCLTIPLSNLPVLESMLIMGQISSALGQAPASVLRVRIWRKGVFEDAKGVAGNIN